MALDNESDLVKLARSLNLRALEVTNRGRIGLGTYYVAAAEAVALAAEEVARAGYPAPLTTVARELLNKYSPGIKEC